MLKTKNLIAFWLIILGCIRPGLAISNEEPNEEPIVLACVDCYSSATLYPQVLARVFNELGIRRKVKWVLFQSFDYSHPSLDGQLERIRKSFPQDSKWYNIDPKHLDKEAFIRLVSELGITGPLIGGMDVGTRVASQLNAVLGRPDNAAETSLLRSSKLLQSEALRADPTLSQYAIPTHHLRSVEEALKFIYENENFEPYPRIVFKNSGGSGGDGQITLEKKNRSEVEKTLRELLGSVQKNNFLEDDHVLIQPELELREFLVETFGNEGDTVITGLWEATKVRHAYGKIPFSIRPISLFSKEAHELRGIVPSINHLMGVQNGMSHPEMVYEIHSGRWYLMENNCRVVGAGIAELDHRIWDLSHLDLYFYKRFASPEMFSQIFASFKGGVSMKQDARVLYVPSFIEGKVTTEFLELLAGIRALGYSPSSPHYEIPPGAETRKTLGLHNVGAMLHFTGETPKIRRAHDAVFDYLRSDRIFTGGSPCEITANVRQHVFSKIPNLEWDFTP